MVSLMVEEGKKGAGGVSWFVEVGEGEGTCRDSLGGWEIHFACPIEA